MRRRVDEEKDRTWRLQSSRYQKIRMTIGRMLPKPALSSSSLMLFCLASTVAKAARRAAARRACEGEW